MYDICPCLLINNLNINAIVPSLPLEYAGVGSSWPDELWPVPEVPTECLKDNAKIPQRHIAQICTQVRLISRSYISYNLDFSKKNYLYKAIITTTKPNEKKKSIMPKKTTTKTALFLCAVTTCSPQCTRVKVSSAWRYSTRKRRIRCTRARYVFSVSSSHHSTLLPLTLAFC